MAGGPSKFCVDNGPELVRQALQRFCEKTGLLYISPGCPWVNGHIGSFNNRPVRILLQLWRSGFSSHFRRSRIVNRKRSVERCERYVQFA